MVRRLLRGAVIFIIKCISKCSRIRTLQAKAMLNNFCVFEELVFFDLWILDSGFRIPDSGFRIPDSGFRIPDSGFRIPDSGFRFPGFRVAPISDLRISLTKSYILDNVNINFHFPVLKHKLRTSRKNGQYFTELIQMRFLANNGRH